MWKSCQAMVEIPITQPCQVLQSTEGWQDRSRAEYLGFLPHLLCTKVKELCNTVSFPVCIKISATRSFRFCLWLVLTIHGPLNAVYHMDKVLITAIKIKGIFFVQNPVACFKSNTISRYTIQEFCVCMSV